MMQRHESRTESRSFSQWDSTSQPQAILVIRFHAIGDVALTLPISSALESIFPNASVDFLTSDICAGMVQTVKSFRAVHVIPSTRTSRRRLQEALRFGVQMRQTKYDIIIDLQRNWQSRLIRHMARPTSWGEFDRYSPMPASDRVLDTFQRIGLPQNKPVHPPPLKSEIVSRARSLLMANGWDGHRPLVVLNPAGLWITRNWPIENYVAFAQRWLSQESVTFLVLGNDRVALKAAHLSEKLGSALINLVNKTSLDEAFAILLHTSLIITEDSGLMHMAWALGIPVVALFGSSRHDWSSPTGAGNRTFHSGDLECGACMAPTCRFGDIRCLARVSPDQVFHAAQDLLLRSDGRTQVGMSSLSFIR